jgi:RHS repeat-associated protein
VVEKGFTKDISGTIVPYEYNTAFTHNGKGQVLSINGPLPGNQDTTSFAYDASTGDLLSITRPLIGSSNFSSYDAAGQVGQVTDVNGQSNSFTYDGRSRITVITHQDDSSASSVSYNTAGLPDYRTDEDGVISSFEYDAVYGRLSKRIDHEGNYITYNYDAQGNMIEKSYYDPTDNRTNWKRSLYQDPAHTMPGKLFKTINPDDTFTQYEYDSEGNIGSVTDPNTHTTYYDYDALNRLTTVSKPGSAITSYDYDVHGNLTSVTDAESHVTTYEYDDMGRVLTSTSPDTGTVTYVYDEAGNLTQKTDAKGIAVGYVYDLLNRLTHVGFPDSTQDIGYTYDTGTYGMGRRTGMTDPSGSATFGYDSRGRLIQKASIVNGYSYTVSQSLTYGGRVSSVVYPTGRIVDYDRSICACSIDAVSTTYNADTVSLLSNLSYRPFGIAKGMDTGSGGTVENEFDQSARLIVANPGADKERTYTYDAVGNLTSVSSPNVAWYNRVYTYDALNRLEHAEGPYGVIDYTYDGVGNRLTKVMNDQTENYIYTSGTNRLQEITGPIAYTYDANGNITGIGNKVLTYNQNNRLIRVEENSTLLGEYTYNGMGQRVMKTVDGVTTVFHYDFNGNIIAESDENGSFVYEYLYKGGSRLALVDVVSVEIYSFLNDRLGTPQMLADSTNTVVWEGIYKPFGDAEVNPNSSVVNNFRFAGQYYDSESGLHYNWHRYYNPLTGRYMTPDPIGLVGGINLFLYANNDPINWTDPLGLWTLGIDFSGTAGSGGAATGGYTYIIDSNLNVARIDHSGGGGLGGATGSVAAQIQWTNAPSIRNFEGTSVSTGVSILPGVSPTAEWIVMPGGYQGVNVGVAGGPSTIVELHSMVEVSKIAWERNLIDIVLDWLRGSDGENPCER